MGQFRAQDLDGYLAIELDVVREIDRSHAPAAELTLDRVLLCQNGSYPLDSRHHVSGPACLRS